MNRTTYKRVAAAQLPDCKMEYNLTYAPPRSTMPANAPLTGTT